MASDYNNLLKYVRKNMTMLDNPASYHSGYAITSPRIDFSIWGTDYTDCRLYISVVHSGNNTGNAWYANFRVKVKANGATSWTKLKDFGSVYPNNTFPIGTSSGTRYYVHGSSTNWTDQGSWYQGYTNLYSLILSIEANDSTVEYDKAGNSSTPGIMRVHETIGGVYHGSTGTYGFSEFTYTFTFAGGPYIYDGGWKPTMAYIYDGGWKPCCTYIYDGGWKEIGAVE